MKSEAASTGNAQNYIVGIGASAGGLEALQKLLSALPANTGFPYIIVQHLSPDYRSFLGEILSKYTQMPVVQVEDGMKVEPDRVYVIQPGKNMRIEGGKLLLTAQKERELNLPVDLFFRSLAEEAGERAIAIILSGTGSDGTNGIKDIKEHDGMIIVQEPESSKFDGMPKSALRTGLVDIQLTPEAIALELNHISSSASRDTPHEKSPREIDEDLMKRIYFILQKVSNINFTHYKLTTILRRIERRMMLIHLEQLPEYVDYLYEHPEEVSTLSREVLIGVTSFFRDPGYFQRLREKGIRDILSHSVAGEPIRVWVAGCSTGEEAYSIAILFCEEMESLKLKRIIKIFATDLDAEAITTAGRGTYGDNIAEAVSPARLSRFFSRQGSAYTVNRELRNMIVFSPHNVFQDPPFGRLDLISCRNMMIYFQPVLQNDLFAIFHISLKNGGYLFLGKSEAIGAFTEAFPVVDATAKLFSHRSDVKIANPKRIPYLQTSRLEEDLSGDGTEWSYPQRRVAGEAGFAEQNTLDNVLFEQFMPACLVVNEKNEIVHTYGDGANYVHMSLGKFSNGLFDVLTEGLKISVSTLLKEARVKHQKVQYKDIRFQGERKEDVITLTVMPINRSITAGEAFYAVVFTELGARGEAEETTPYDLDRVASQRITDLEQDLNDVQGQLDRSVADQQCVTEELQAANEELLTANEELQSSNEELQSVNEELYTVNSEYQQKLTELANLNDDIANFLSTTLIGIIFVDEKLNIRRYTNYVTHEFSVMDHDIGRSLKFISYHFPSTDISGICDGVLKTLVPDEREVRTSRKKVFLMRVAPYRTAENRILGCVITLVDVTAQKRERIRLQSTEERLSVMQQVNEAKSDYLSHIAHEIRTPMSALSGLSRLTLHQAHDNPELLTNLKKMADTIDYLSSIVTDISEASKSERAGGIRVAEPFSLRGVTDAVSTVIAPQAQEAGLTFTVTLSDDLTPAYIGNRTALQQILLNLLGNAVKYNRPGGSVSLKVSEKSKNGVSAALCFVVSDTGVGISKEYLPRLFKPFSRETESRAEESGSLGLGLSIAYNLIRSMDGAVSVESEVGVGSVFTVSLLLERFLDEEGQPDSVADTSVSKYDLSGRSVLIAEDNQLNRTMLGSYLNYEGISFIEVSNGEEALQEFLDAPEGAFDCILMDMRMPRLDGIGATEKIRASGRSDAKTVPIIGVSANGFEDDIHQASLAGVDGYITKPIDRDELLSAMNRLIKPRKEETT